MQGHREEAPALDQGHVNVLLGHVCGSTQRPGIGEYGAMVEY
jgi:hypothetical protein